MNCPYNMQSASVYGIQPGIDDSQRCPDIEAGIGAGWIEPVVYASKDILYARGVGDKSLRTLEAAGHGEIRAQTGYVYGLSPVPEAVLVGSYSVVTGCGGQYLLLSVLVA